MAKKPTREIPPLRRKVACREPKRQFVLYCEGKNTEPDYFYALKAVHLAALIEIEPVPAAGVPWTVAEKAIQHLSNIRRRRRNSFEQNDEVWAVFDRDEHSRVYDAMQRCEKAGVGVALSNPCFEVWLILHFIDYNKPDDRHKAQRHLRECCGDYDPKTRKTADFSKFMPHILEAEQRAERLCKSRHEEGMPNGVSSTTVFKLTRAIRIAAQTSSAQPIN